MISRDHTAALAAFLSDKWPEIKGYSLLLFAAMFEIIGLQYSVSGIQDFITWGVTTCTAIVGVWYVYVQIQSKRLDIKIKKKQLEDEANQ